MRMSETLQRELRQILPTERAATERARWDALWATGARASDWTTCCYAEGLADNHIDTALRQWLGRPTDSEYQAPAPGWGVSPMPDEFGHE